jgi:hypothetical protein
VVYLGAKAGYRVWNFRRGPRKNMSKKWDPTARIGPLEIGGNGACSETQTAAMQLGQIDTLTITPSEPKQYALYRKADLGRRHDRGERRPRNHSPASS